MKRSSFRIRVERSWPSCSSRTSCRELMGARVERDWRFAGEGFSAPWGPQVHRRLCSHTALTQATLRCSQSLCISRITSRWPGPGHS